MTRLWPSSLKQRPRPMHNLDSVRAGVVVKDASIMEEVYETIGREVGPWLRVKNNYREAFDSKESHGYVEMARWRCCCRCCCCCYSK